MSTNEKTCEILACTQEKQVETTPSTYQVLMRVTSEIIQDFQIPPEDITWALIGLEKCQVIKVTTSKEVYDVYMRPEWAEDKRRNRNSRCLVPGKKGRLIRCPEYIPDPNQHDKTKSKMIRNQCKNCDRFTEVCREENKMASLDVLKTEGIELMAPGSLEETVLLKIMLEELIYYLNSVNPKYGQIVQMLYDNHTQTEIAKELGISQRTVSDDIRKLRELIKKYMAD